MEFIIISTWNGEGYSYSNKAYTITADSKGKAQAHIISLLTSKLAEYNNGNETIAIAEGHIGYDDGIDQGSFQWIHREGVYGIEILCNTNDVIVHKTKQDYDSAVQEAVSQAYDKELEDSDSPFIAAYEGDYDYQFIKFN